MMMDYNHWSPLGLLGEILPWEDNRIELATAADATAGSTHTDRFGLPVAKVTFSLKDNDKKMIEFGKNKVMEIMGAAGAKEIVQESRYAHLVGAARMSATPETGVCDKFGRTWDVDNLFIMDGSVMPTQGSANPGLTISGVGGAHGGLLDFGERRDFLGGTAQHAGARYADVAVASGDVYEGCSSPAIS